MCGNPHMDAYRVPRANQYHSIISTKPCSHGYKFEGNTQIRCNAPGTTSPLQIASFKYHMNKSDHSGNCKMCFVSDDYPGYWENLKAEGVIVIMAVGGSEWRGIVHEKAKKKEVIENSVDECLEMYELMANCVTCAQSNQATPKQTEVTRLFNDFNPQSWDTSKEPPESPPESRAA